MSSPSAQGESDKAANEPRSDGALADWEDEGGSARAIPAGHVECEQVRRLPLLPLGYEARSVWIFRDKTGRFSYEFNRVYGPPAWPDRPTLQRPLDEGLSYWGVTWSAFDEQGQERPEGRWVSFSQARERRGARLTFDRFSSLTRMIDSLPGLLRVHEIHLAPLAEVTPPAEASPRPRRPGPRRPGGRPVDIKKASLLAGVDEAKDGLIEVIEFLKTPEKIRKLGGEIPKGILLIGPRHRQDVAGQGGGRGQRAFFSVASMTAGFSCKRPSSASSPGSRRRTA